MANDRLYIVNKDTKEYVCIAKYNGVGWDLGNVDILKKLLEDTSEIKETTDLVIGTENDDEFFKTYLRDGKNVNETNEWNYYE